MEKKRPGQPWKPPKAADHNAIALAADFSNRGGQNVGGEVVANWLSTGTVVNVKNVSGSDQRRGDVLALNGDKLLTDVDRQHPWFEGDKLSSTSAVYRNAILVVCIDPIPDDKIGPAQLAGVGAVLVNVQETWHRRAYPVAGQDVLRTGLFGPFELMHTPTGTGEKLVFASLGHSANRGLFIKTTSAISAAVLTSGRLTLGSGTAKVQSPYSTATQYDEQDQTATIYNQAGDAIDSGVFLFVTPTDDWLPLATIEACTEPT
jgi:hypothetical protein